MDNSGNVFNPNQWKKETLSAGLTDAEIAILDERYINVGESVFNENIDNLNVKTLNVSSIGKIYFYKDNSEQSTAFSPNIVTQQINNLLLSDNIFKGENIFTNLNVCDSSGNASQIIQTENNLTIDSKGTQSYITFQTYNYDSSNMLQYDYNGTLAGITELYAFTVVTFQLQLNNNSQSINSTSNNLSILNKIAGKNISFVTTSRSSTGLDTTSTLTYSSSGDLSGINNLSAHSAIFNDITFRNTNVTINQTLTDLIIDNKKTSSSFKIQNYDSSNNQRIFTIDQYINLSGINDINCNKIYLPNISHSVSTTGEYKVLNNYRGGLISLTNTDSSGILHQIQIDSNATVSGVNDLKCQRLLLNNTAIDETGYKDLLNRTQMVGFWNDPKQTQIVNPSTGKGILFVPTANYLNYNGLVQPGDNVIVGYNANLNDTTTTLTLVSHSNLEPCGIRISEYATELTKPKVMDALTFSDMTRQTTAMTDDYLKNVVTNNTQMIKYLDSPFIQTRILNPSNNGFYMVPNVLGGSYSNLSKSGDNIIVSTNNALGLTVWTSKPACGIRITEDNTELNKAKIMDNLTFSDSTVQTTAMTDEYLTNKIKSVVNSLMIIPSGTILAYGTDLSGVLPTGYLWCIGTLVSQITYANLYAVIGNKFMPPNTVATSGWFYLPDLRGAYLKGAGFSNLWNKTTSINYVGNIQQGIVGHHSHKYTDRGIGSYKIAPQTTSAIYTTIANNTSGDYWTDGYTYNDTAHTISEYENRPNSVGINYIIKY